MSLVSISDIPVLATGWRDVSNQVLIVGRLDESQGGVQRPKPKGNFKTFLLASPFDLVIHTYRANFVYNRCKLT